MGKSPSLSVVNLRIDPNDWIVLSNELLYDVTRIEKVLKKGKEERYQAEIPLLLAKVEKLFKLANIELTTSPLLEHLELRHKQRGFVINLIKLVIACRTLSNYWEAAPIYESAILVCREVRVSLRELIQTRKLVERGVLNQVGPESRGSQTNFSHHLTISRQLSNASSMNSVLSEKYALPKPPSQTSFYLSSHRFTDSANQVSNASHSLTQASIQPPEVVVIPEITFNHTIGSSQSNSAAQKHSPLPSPVTVGPEAHYRQDSSNSEEEFIGNTSTMDFMDTTFESESSNQDNETAILEEGKVCSSKSSSIVLIQTLSNNEEKPDSFKSIPLVQFPDNQNSPPGSSSLSFQTQNISTKSVDTACLVSCNHSPSYHERLERESSASVPSENMSHTASEPSQSSSLKTTFIYRPSNSSLTSQVGTTPIGETGLNNSEVTASCITEGSSIGTLSQSPSTGSAESLVSPAAVQDGFVTPQSNHSEGDFKSIVSPTLQPINKQPSRISLSNRTSSHSLVFSELQLQAESQLGSRANSGLFRRRNLNMDVSYSDETIETELGQVSLPKPSTPLTGKPLPCKPISIKDPILCRKILANLIDSYSNQPVDFMESLFMIALDPTSTKTEFVDVLEEMVCSLSTLFAILDSLGVEDYKQTIVINDTSLRFDLNREFTLRKDTIYSDIDDIISLADQFSVEDCTDLRQGLTIVLISIIKEYEELLLVSKCILSDPSFVSMFADGVDQFQLVPRSELPSEVLHLQETIRDLISINLLRREQEEQALNPELAKQNLEFLLAQMDQANHQANHQVGVVSDDETDLKLTFQNFPLVSPKLGELSPYSAMSGYSRATSQGRLSLFSLKDHGSVSSFNKPTLIPRPLYSQPSRPSSVVNLLLNRTLQPKPSVTSLIAPVAARVLFEGSFSGCSAYPTLANCNIKRVFFSPTIPLSREDTFSTAKISESPSKGMHTVSNQLDSESNLSLDSPSTRESDVTQETDYKPNPPVLNLESSNRDPQTYTPVSVYRDCSFQTFELPSCSGSDFTNSIHNITEPIVDSPISHELQILTGPNHVSCSLGSSQLNESELDPHDLESSSDCRSDSLISQGLGHVSSNVSVSTPSSEGSVGIPNLHSDSKSRVFVSNTQLSHVSKKSSFNDLDTDSELEQELIGHDLSYQTVSKSIFESAQSINVNFANISSLSKEEPSTYYTVRTHNSSVLPLDSHYGKSQLECEVEVEVEVEVECEVEVEVESFKSNPIFSDEDLDEESYPQDDPSLISSSADSVDSIQLSESLTSLPTNSPSEKLPCFNASYSGTTEPSHDESLHQISPVLLVESSSSDSNCHHEVLLPTIDYGQIKPGVPQNVKSQILSWAISPFGDDLGFIVTDITLNNLPNRGPIQNTLELEPEPAQPAQPSNANYYLKSKRAMEDFKRATVFDTSKGVLSRRSSQLIIGSSQAITGENAVTTGLVSQHVIDTSQSLTLEIKTTSDTNQSDDLDSSNVKPPEDQDQDHEDGANIDSGLGEDLVQVKNLPSSDSLKSIPSDSDSLEKLDYHVTSKPLQAPLSNQVPETNFNINPKRISVARLVDHDDLAFLDDMSFGYNQGPALSINNGTPNSIHSDLGDLGITSSDPEDYSFNESVSSAHHPMEYSSIIETTSSNDAVLGNYIQIGVSLGEYSLDAIDLGIDGYSHGVTPKPCSLHSVVSHQSKGSDHRSGKDHPSNHSDSVSNHDSEASVPKPRVSRLASEPSDAGMATRAHATLSEGKDKSNTVSKKSQSMSAIGAIGAITEFNGAVSDSELTHRPATGKSPARTLSSRKIGRFRRLLTVAKIKAKTKSSMLTFVAPHGVEFQANQPIPLNPYYIGRASEKDTPRRRVNRSGSSASTFSNKSQSDMSNGSRKGSGMESNTAGSSRKESTEPSPSHSRKNSVPGLGSPGKKSPNISRKNSAVSVTTSDGAGQNKTKRMSRASTASGKVTKWFLCYEYSEADILMKDGLIVDATLEALVERLTLHDEAIDSKFMETFLLTFRSFTDASEFLDLLIHRYTLKPPENLEPEDMALWVSHKQTAVRIRVNNILKTWLESYFYESDDGICLKKLIDFCSGIMMDTMPSAAKRILTTAGEMYEKLKAESSTSKLTKSKNMDLMAAAAMAKLPNHLPPMPLIPRGISKSLIAQLPFRIIDLDPLEVARQLTIMDCRAFSLIRPHELIGLEFSKKASTAVQHVRGMTEATNEITSLICDCILKEFDIKKRAMLIKYFIRVGENLLLLKNYNSLMPIVGALNSSMIARLKKTWDLLLPKFKETFDHLRKSTDHSRNYADYRNVLKSSAPPCLPFLGIYLTDLTFTDEGNAAFKEGEDCGKKHVNFAKYYRTVAIVQEIQKFQVPYNLIECKQLQDRLKLWMKTSNSLWDEDVFYNKSLLLEPRNKSQPALTTRSKAEEKNIINDDVPLDAQAYF